MHEILAVHMVGPVRTTLGAEEADPTAHRPCESIRKAPGSDKCHTKP